MHPLKGPRTGDALTTDLAHFPNDAKHHGRKSPPCARMIMFTRTIVQSRSPKGSRIHHYGPIAFMPMGLPTRQAFNLSLPEP